MQPTDEIETFRDEIRKLSLKARKNKQKVSLIRNESKNKNQLEQTKIEFKIKK